MKICSVAAARPNFVKLAAVHHAVIAAGHEHVIVHTGQHYDPLFSDIFFEQLDIAMPTHNLEVHGGTREEVIVATERAFSAVLPSIKPDIILVYGDVNGAVGAAQAAKKAGIRLAHVEAGLRSFDDSMPEEHNRIAVDRIADLLFCSEQSGMDNLEKENIPGQRFLVGNTMIDTLIRMLPHINAAGTALDVPARFAIATLHRPSNVDRAEDFKRSIDFLNSVAEHIPVIFPVHLRAKKNLEAFGLKDSVSKNIQMVDPHGYVQFLHLLSKSNFILTDSGGIQEEAAFLKKRCFTLRKNTERPSTIQSGSNILIDLESSADQAAVVAFAAQPVEVQVAIPELWDGRAGERIVKLLA